MAKQLFYDSSRDPKWYTEEIQPKEDNLMNDNIQNTPAERAPTVPQMDQFAPANPALHNDGTVRNDHVVENKHPHTVQEERERVEQDRKDHKAADKKQSDKK